MSDATVKKSGGGKVILILSIILSIVLISLGVVIKAGLFETTETYTLYEGSAKSVYPEDDYVAFEFTPNYSGTYYFLFDGGYFDGVEDSDGDYVSYTTNYNYDFNCKEVYLSSGDTYTFYLEVSSYQVYAMVSSNNAYN